MILLIAVVGVTVVDGAVKSILRRGLAEGSLVLGNWGSLRIVPHRIWLSRLETPQSAAMTSALLGLAAVPLVIFGALVPPAAVFVGLLLGGALSNWLEQAVRGSVSDYICLSFWPAFNLADAAITAGAAGIAITVWTLVS